MAPAQLTPPCTHTHPHTLPRSCSTEGLRRASKKHANGGAPDASDAREARQVRRDVDAFVASLPIPSSKSSSKGRRMAGMHGMHWSGGRRGCSGGRRPHCWAPSSVWFDGARPGGAGQGAPNPPSVALNPSTTSPADPGTLAGAVKSRLLRSEMERLDAEAQLEEW